MSGGRSRCGVVAQQCCTDAVECLLGQPVQLLDAPVGEPLDDVDHGHVCHAQRHGLPLCQLEERRRTQRRCGNAALFELDGVVDTPRCAAASVAAAVEDRVAFGQLLQ